MTLALRSVCYLAAAALVIIGLFAPALRQWDGWLTPQGWLLAVVGVAVGVAGYGWRRRWQASGWLFALALVAQGAALQLIFAPPYDMYQFVRPPAAIAGSWRAVCLAAVLAHGVYVGWACLRAWPGLWQRIRSRLGWLQLVVLLGFLLNAAILVSTDGLQYGFGVFIVLWVAAAGVLNLMLAVRALPDGAVEAFRQSVESWQSGARGAALARWLPWGLAIAVVAAAAFIALVVYEGVPHISDSISYLFQAKYFGMGRLYLPPPPDDVSFRISHVVNDGGKWYAYGFPGWPAVLSLGVLAGAPWLVNPLLGGVTVLLAHRWVARLYDVRIANATVLLLAASPWFLYMSGSFMGHTLSVALALAALVLVEDARRGGVWWRGLGAGAALGLLFLTRPLEGIVMSLAVGLRIFGAGGERPPFRIVLPICLGAILVGSAIFPYNQVLTGDPLYPPQLKNADTVWGKGVDRMGFGPEIGNVGWVHHDPLPGHSPINAVLNANKNFYAANLELFGWSFGSLVFVALALVLKGWARNDLLSWGTISVVLLATALYWHPGGPDFGARYWYQLMIPFIILTVRGAQLFAERFAGAGGMAVARTHVALFVIAASILATVNFVPWRAAGKYHHYKGRTDDIALLARERGFAQGALVFVRSLSDVPEDNENDYPSAFILNAADLSGPATVYVRYLGPEKLAKLRELFPGRPVWVIGRDAVEKPIRVLQPPVR